MLNTHTPPPVYWSGDGVRRPVDVSAIWLWQRGKFKIRLDQVSAPLSLRYANRRQMDKYRLSFSLPFKYFN